MIVVGAGIAGLSAAVTLKKQYGLQALVLEQGDAVGGRVRTDVVDGFLLDRGFQIFLTGYPEAQAILDYKALELKDFYAGALVRKDGQFHRVADPFRHPVDGIASLPNPVGTVMDKVRVGLLRCACCNEPHKHAMISQREAVTTSLLTCCTMLLEVLQPDLLGCFFPVHVPEVLMCLHGSAGQPAAAAAGVTTRAPRWGTCCMAPCLQVQVTAGLMGRRPRAARDHHHGGAQGVYAWPSMHGTLPPPLPDARALSLSLYSARHGPIISSPSVHRYLLATEPSSSFACALANCPPPPLPVHACQHVHGVCLRACAGGGLQRVHDQALLPPLHGRHLLQPRAHHQLATPHLRAAHARAGQQLPANQGHRRGAGAAGGAPASRQHPPQ